MNNRHKPSKKESILTTALEMFNVHGSYKVTTNHIAKAMGISPGNLYYHFKNKEDIIRELLTRLIDEFNPLFQIGLDQKAGPDLIADITATTGELIYKYRFIYLELAALLARDELFKEMYCGIKEKRAWEFALLIESVGGSSAFRRKITPEERDAIVFVMWTFVEGIVTALHSGNVPVTPQSVVSHFKKIFYILKAYLKPDVWDSLSKKIDLV
jgi:AcrR family transcriptional regulator